MDRPEKARRTLGRLAFRMPRPARFATHEIILIDLSVRGAGIRHHVKIAPNTKGLLRFRLERQYHEVDCVLTRSRLELVKQGSKTLQIYRSALRFEGMGRDDDEDDGLESIRTAMCRRVERAVRRQQADAFGNPGLMGGIDESSGAIPVDLLTSWMESRRYVCCTLDRAGHWNCERVDNAEQPISGFTVSAEEGEREIALLRKTWEVADESQRRLIRIFAQLALTDPSDEKRGRYDP
jgi:hypothetical protein